MPQYVKDNDENIRIYVSTTNGSWVLGTSGHEDYIFKLSSSIDQESPANWEGWVVDAETSVEQPTLRLEDPTRFPPYHLTLAPGGLAESDSENPSIPVFSGDYILNITSLTNGFPFYSRVGDEKSIFISIDRSSTSWVLGDDEKPYIFTMNKEPSQSPIHWNNSFWRNNGTLETPILELLDPLLLPPPKITLNATDNAETFYAGTYILNQSNLHLNFP